ncbi:MAG: nickel pincer cofactor biosynthesis protein LarC [Nitriliruptorales bacterium]|nr:nickel pincer cofactor biosynthesis protein LarC [Nitriliruptorales bacterium]
MTGSPPRLGHVDPFSGASGDMLLGAAIDAGAGVGAVRGVLAGLRLDGWHLEAAEVTRGGIGATVVRVQADEAAPARDWAAIRRLLVEADLPEPVRRRALATFERLAAAEARIHRVPPERVHFHEVGGVDAIVDVVGVCAGLYLLGLERLSASPVPLGSGSVHTTHGELPVPAPAVLELLRGCAVVGLDTGGELCTPTGAALLAEWVDRWGPPPAMTVESAGYGGGRRDPARPNVLRLILGGPIDRGGQAAVERLEVIEATVDDLPGEIVPLVLEAARAAGARDAWVRQVLMKKGRPGVEIVCLVEPARAGAVSEVLFRHTTTLGVRRFPVERQALAREFVTVAVGDHPVRLKIGRLGGAVVNVKPEFGDCAAVATATGQPVKDVMASARGAWRKLGDRQEASTEPAR